MPLTQTFIGIKTTNKSQQLADMDRVCYEKVLEEVKKGEQVRLSYYCFIILTPHSLS